MCNFALIKKYYVINKDHIMAKKFAEHNGLDLVKTNKDVLAEWEKNDIFHKSIDEREGCPQFIFFEGPPSANGHPGIHHVLARSIKDTFNRYKTMQGFQVHRKAGWDTHGLPVELGVEKELGITKKDIDNKASEKYISVEDYNKKCRENVMMFTQEWRTLTEEMGYFVDLDHPYITYDNKYIETLWWLLKQLYNKGLLYKGYTIQPYSPGAGTGLSSHELNQPGCYRDVKDTTVTAQFAIQPADWEVLKTKSQSLKHAKEWGAPYFLAWTTTPWTLASNTALCVGPKFDYVVIQTYNPYNAKKMTLIMANDLVNAYLKPEGQVTDDGELPEYQHGDKYVPYKIIAHFKGTDLEGIHYQQLMPWVKPCEKIGDFAPSFVNEYAAAHPEKVFASEDGRDKFVEMADEAFRVILGDYVTTDDGTGIVHIAPTFGADDAKVAKDANIPALYLISKKGENYFNNRYSTKRTLFAPLGSEDIGISKKSSDGIIRVFTCSNVIPLKRVDLIFECINKFAEKHKVEWTHIGGGTDFEKLKDIVENNHIRQLKPLLLGMQDHSIVIDFYRTQPVDLFMNLSTIEGVPVSIMEALSCNIPVVATNVGGVSEIVTEETGVLVTSNPTVEEVVNAMEKAIYGEYTPRIFWNAHYNADINYSLYAKELSKIVNT